MSTSETKIMKPHKTLPSPLTLYMRDERLKVSYEDFDNIFWVLFKKNIHIKKKMHLYRQRFTIAHEVGHYYYWSTHHIDSPQYPNSPYEREADEFAMETLLPLHTVVEKAFLYGWTSYEMSDYFGVEPQWIEERLKWFCKIH